MPQPSSGLSATWSRAKRQMIRRCCAEVRSHGAASLSQTTVSRVGARNGNTAVSSAKPPASNSAAAQIPIALAPFGQIESSQARRHEGTGLGLPLAKRLVEMMGGVLRLDSELGKGTRIRFSLPLAVPAETAGPCESARLVTSV